MSTSASSVSSETPCQLVPSLDQRVTQWMSTIGVSCGSAISSCHDHRCSLPFSAEITNSQVSSDTRGVGPAESTGKSSVRY